MSKLHIYHSEDITRSVLLGVEAVAQCGHAKLDRILADMNDFGEERWNRATGSWDLSPYSRWEMSRIVFPRIMAELDALELSS